MRKILLVAVLALSACGKKGSEAKGDCAASVKNAIDLSQEEFKKNGVSDESVIKIRESSTTRCKEDKWTNEVIKCLADGKKADDVAKCQQMMSKEQSDNMSKAITGIMATQPDPGSGSAPPDMGSGSGSAQPEAGSGSSAEAGSAGSGSGIAPGPVAGLPAECNDYKAMVEKLAACEKLPAASRDMLKKTFDTTSKQWTNIDKMPAEAKTALVTGCKQGAEALKTAAGATCGF